MRGRDSLNIFRPKSPGMRILSRGGGQSWESYLKSVSAFIAGDFNFSTNQWLDTSGNDNHATLKNASARTGNGSNLDYTITGLLTTDTIEVVSGSDTPTIPLNGTLRIGATQTVYGVTIKRAGTVWAIIPFCEPYIWSLPTFSFDVSGNNHSAYCATLTSDNITTQSTYFYLMEHGYTEGSINRLNWDFTQWSGEFPNQIFAGTVSFVETPSATRYIEKYGDDGCRFIISSGTTYFGVKTGNGFLTIGKKYIIKAECIYKGSGLNKLVGIGDTGGGFVGADKIDTIGSYKKIFTQSTTAVFTIRQSNITYATDIAIRNLEIREALIVPALMDKSGDYYGRPIEYPQTGDRYLRYAGDLCWENINTYLPSQYDNEYGNIIKQGYLSSIKKYLIETTETNHFGIGNIAGDVINGDNTTICNPYNTCREIITEGKFIGKTLTFDDLGHIGFNLYYTNKKILMNYPKSRYTIAAVMADSMYGLNYMPYENYINKFVILKTPISYENHVLMHSYVGVNPSPKPLITYTTDSFSNNNHILTHNILDAVGARSNITIFVGSPKTYAQERYWKSIGYYTCIHRPYDPSATPATPLPTDLGYENDSNYNNEQLSALYEDNIRVYRDERLLERYVYKIHPGGSAGNVALQVAPLYFHNSFTVTGYYTLLPIADVCNFIMPREQTVGNDTKFSLLIQYKAFGHFYGHDYTTWIADLPAAIDFISAHQKAGENLRIYTLGDIFDVISNIL